MSRVSKKRRLGLRNLREVALTLPSMSVGGTLASMALSPIDGYIDNAGYVVTTASTSTASIITVSNGTDSVDAAATITVGATAAVGGGSVTTFTTKPRVSKGDIVQALSNGGGTTGVVVLTVTVREFA